MANKTLKAPPVGTVLGERYMLLRFLGSGAIGAVYEASTPSDERVAVKILLEIDQSAMAQELSARFVREARLASTLESPHIVPVVDSGLDATLGIPYLVMPLLSGFDLDVLLERSGALHPTVAVRIIEQACRGLEVAHRAQVIHRDIKPGNIFLAHDPTGAVTVRILDFGMAKMGATDEGITRAGAILGTPHYMSPEQSTNSKNVDARADIWGIGATLYHALTGFVPFEEENTFMDLHLAINSKDIMPIQERAPWIDPGLAKVVHGTLLRDLDQRCPNATELAAALEPFLAGSSEVNMMMLEPVPKVLRKIRAQRAPTIDIWDPGVPASQLPPVSAEPVDPLLGRQLGGRYTLLRRLGRGPGLYEAIDAEANRFAIRVLAGSDSADPAAGRRFVREARALLAIRSPHVVSLVDAEFDQQLNQPFIVMELLYGIDLGRVIDKHGALEPRVAIPLFVQACRGLESAHQHQTVHRDVRPENLFLQEQPSGELVVKLTGFGVVKALGDAGGYDVTRANDVLGHPMYMSPEQARNPAAVDARSDVWSLGATLFHALCGTPPWPPDLMPGDLLLQIGTGRPAHAQDKAPWLEPDLVDVLHQTLRRDPAGRFASMQLLGEALGPLSRKKRVLLKDLGPLPSELRHHVAPRTGPPDPDPAGIEAPSPVSSSTPKLSPLGGAVGDPSMSTLPPAALLELQRRRSSARTTQLIAVAIGVLVTALLGGYLGWELLLKP